MAIVATINFTVTFTITTATKSFKLFNVFTIKKEIKNTMGIGYIWIYGALEQNV